MPIFVKLMRNTALAAAFAVGLASCAATPVLAQENCIARDAVVAQAEVATASGAVLTHYRGEQAIRAWAVLRDAIGEPPREIEITEILIVRGPAAAVVALIEGDKSCYVVQTSPVFSERMRLAAEGAPA